MLVAVGLPHPAPSSIAWCRRLLLIASVIDRWPTRRMGNRMGAMMATLSYTAIYQDFRVPPEGFEPSHTV